jgi:integrase
MEINVYAPGTRITRKKGKEYANKKWVTRFSYGGQRYEISTDAENARGAKKEAIEFIAELKQQRGPAPGSVMEIIAAYKAGRRPANKEAGYLVQVETVIGARAAEDLAQADFDECCTTLYPKATNETWNRQVFTPLLAALNWSGITVRVKRPRQKAIEDQAYDCLTEKQRDTYIAAARDRRLRAVLCLYMLDGLRPTEGLNILRQDRPDAPYADVRRGLIKTIQRKGGKVRVHWRAMHPKTKRLLAALPAIKEDEGRFFPWRERWHLRPLLKDLNTRTGIRFHPHMGRHTFGDIAHAKGASLRDLKDMGAWLSDSAALRYTHKSVERQRALKKAL